MRRDGIAVSERVEPSRELTPVFQDNPALANRPHLNPLAVDEFLALVGLEQKPVARRHFQLAGLANIEGRGGGAGRDEIHFRPIRPANP